MLNITLNPTGDKIISIALNSSVLLVIPDLLQQI